MLCRNTFSSTSSDPGCSGWKWSVFGHLFLHPYLSNQHYQHLNWDTGAPKSPQNNRSLINYVKFDIHSYFVTFYIRICFYQQSCLSYSTFFIPCLYDLVHWVWHVTEKETSQMISANNMSIYLDLSF